MIGLGELKTYALYGFGILMCLSGVLYLAVGYIKYLSDLGKLAILILMAAMFASFGKYFEERGL